MNAELQRQTFELDRSSGLLDSVVASLPAVVIVVDQAGQVELWNEPGRAVFGLLPVRGHRPGVPRPRHGAAGGGAGREPRSARPSVGSATTSPSTPMTAAVVIPLRCRVQITPLVLDRRELHGAVLVISTGNLP